MVKVDGPPLAGRIRTPADHVVVGPPIQSDGQVRRGTPDLPAGFKLDGGLSSEMRIPPRVKVFRPIEFIKGRGAESAGNGGIEAERKMESEEACGDHLAWGGVSVETKRRKELDRTELKDLPDSWCEVDPLWVSDDGRAEPDPGEVEQPGAVVPLRLPLPFLVPIRGRGVRVIRCVPEGEGRPQGGGFPPSEEVASFQGIGVWDRPGEPGGCPAGPSDQDQAAS